MNRAVIMDEANNELAVANLSVAQRRREARRRKVLAGGKNRLNRISHAAGGREAVDAAPSLVSTGGNDDTDDVVSALTLSPTSVVEDIERGPVDHDDPPMEYPTRDDGPSPPSCLPSILAIAPEPSVVSSSNDPSPASTRAPGAASRDQGTPGRRVGRGLRTRKRGDRLADDVLSRSSWGSLGVLGALVSDVFLFPLRMNVRHAVLAVFVIIFTWCPIMNVPRQVASIVAPPHWINAVCAQSDIVADSVSLECLLLLLLVDVILVLALSRIAPGGTPSAGGLVQDLLLTSVGRVSGISSSFLKTIVGLCRVVWQLQKDACFLMVVYILSSRLAARYVELLSDGMT